MEILGNAQTYLGVLATFLVLCLINNKTNNFLLSTILAVADDSLRVLLDYALSLKSEIHLIYENKDDKTDKIKYLIEKARQYSKPELEIKLLKNRNTARILENNFFEEAMNVRSSFRPRKILYEKKELTYVALLTLILIIVVMLVDALSFLSIYTRNIFIIFLLYIGSVFSFLLYRNFFSKGKVLEINIEERFRKPNKFNMILGVSFSFFLWLTTLLFINEPVVALFLFPLIMIGTTYITKRKRILICDTLRKYDKTFVLRHSAYIILFAFGCTIVLIVLTSFSFIYDILANTIFCDNLIDWNNSIRLFKEPNIAKYFVLFFFSLNTFILPLLIGYIHLKIEESHVSTLMKDIYDKYKDKVQAYEEKFKVIEQEIEECGSII